MAIMWKTAMKKIERFEDVGEWRETGTLTQGVRQVTQRSGARPSGPLALLLGRSLSVAPIVLLVLVGLLGMPVQAQAQTMPPARARRRGRRGGERRDMMHSLRTAHLPTAPVGTASATPGGKPVPFISARRLFVVACALVVACKNTGQV